MRILGYFWAKNQQNLWFLQKNAILGKNSPYIIYCLEMPDFHLAAEGDTADRESAVLVAIV